jgi:carboxylesterase type B
MRSMQMLVSSPQISNTDPRTQAVEDALRLSQKLGCDQADLAGLLLQSLDQAQAWLAVKEHGACAGCL